MNVVELLQAEIAQGPLAAALASREAVAGDAQTAAAIADDAACEMTVRVAALLALAIVAQNGVHIPDAAVSALEDDLLIDAVLASSATPAITGVAAAARDRITERLRRYLAVRIAAAGATGVHVAELLLAAGDVDAAVRAALPTLTDALRDARDDDPIVLALATILHDWAASHTGLDDSIAAALPLSQRETLSRALHYVRASTLTQ